MIFDDLFWLFISSSLFPLKDPLRACGRGREDSVEAVQYYVHVEAIKIDNPLVDVLLVEALAAVFEKELGEAVHRPQDFCSKRVIYRNPVFVDDAMFVDFLHKIPKPGSKDAVFAEDKAYRNPECFQLVMEGVKVLGDRHCHLSRRFDVINTLDEPPFC